MFGVNWRILLAKFGAMGQRLRGFFSSVASWARVYIVDSIDVWLKLLGALAAAMVALVAATWNSRYYAVSVLNQREQAESELRTSMLQSLIDPILAESGEGAANIHQQRVIAELLALNFHRHFEFKPLLTRIYGRLSADNEEDREGRSSLESVTRRIMNRQISLLNSVAESLDQDPDVSSDFFFYEVAEDEIDRIGATAQSECSPSAWYSRKYANPDDAPAGEEHTLLVYSSACFSSADGKYRVQVSPREIDYDQSSVELKIVVDRIGWFGEETVQDYDFGLTSFDLPLTDNSVLDANHRFAIALYDMEEYSEAPEAQYPADLDSEAVPQPLFCIEAPFLTRSPDQNEDAANPESEAGPEAQPPACGDPSFVSAAARTNLKFIWFPTGYISERERPLNYPEIRELLGVSE